VTSIERAQAECRSSSETLKSPTQGTQERYRKQLPRGLLLSLTWDRGTELAMHKLFSRDGAAVLLLRPQEPWQRGTNENTNGREAGERALEQAGRAVALDRYGKRQLVIACDSYSTVPANMRAVGATVEALRGARARRRGASRRVAP
jgi:hypothetical protein